MLISGTISSFINGISQQAPAVRLASQGDIQENGYSSVTDGLMKRPPTEYVSQLTTNTYSNLWTHFINRSSTERYVVCIDDAANLTVYNLLTGEACTVTNTASDSYLTSADPIHDFAAVTIEDATIITNRTVSTAIDEYTVSGGSSQVALVWVRAGNYDTTYNIDLNGTTATYTTKKSAVVNSDDDIQTINIAAQLIAQLGTPSDFTIAQNGSVILIQTNDGADFTISVSDTLSNTGLALTYKSVQSFSTLPSIAAAGMVVKVYGDITTSADDYWVSFACTNTAEIFGPGIWSETVAPNITVQMREDLLPHELIRNDDGTFTFQQADYTQRLVGDLTTSPDPSFIGAPIQNVFVFQERLGFLSNTNVVMSRTDDVFNFYRGTVLNVLPDDPIDVSAASARVLNLRHALPFNSSLLIFADDTQLALTSQGETGLTTQSVQIIPATSYDSDIYAEPILVGNMVYFAFPNGSWAGLRELYVVTDTGQNEATNITAPTPHYISGSIIKLTASSIENVMVVQSEGDTGGLSIYKWEWNGNQKIQSSWSHWSFSTDVLAVEFMDSTLYLLMQSCDGVYLETMNLEAGRVDEGSNYLTLLDRRISSDDVTVTYDINTNTSQIILPYDLCGNEMGGAFSTGGGALNVIPPPIPPTPVPFDIGVIQLTPGFYGGDVSTGTTMVGSYDPRIGGSWGGTDTVSGNSWALTGAPGDWTLTASSSGNVQTWHSIAALPFGNDARYGYSPIIWEDVSISWGTDASTTNGYFTAGLYRAPYDPTLSPEPSDIGLADLIPDAPGNLSPGTTSTDTEPTLPYPTVVLSWDADRNAAAYRVQVWIQGGAQVIDYTVPAPGRTYVAALALGQSYRWNVTPISLETFANWHTEDSGATSSDLYFSISTTSTWTGSEGAGYLV
jgi:hypothetical protein